ncbi:L,D-transpeptidase family protein [Streptomyces sp. NPDC012751]|uniref:L,D-transpeptidase family protein n=1 Tax=Streptomyces sp. NPDC012751 TaxID=3364846 RepID=UPI00369AA59B
MRIPGRPAALTASAAVLAALTALCGCTAQPQDSDAKRGLSVHVRLPAGRTPVPVRTAGVPPARSGAPAPAATPERPASTTPRTASTVPAAGSAVPAPRVLWSRGDSGPGVRAAQARLRQVAWLSAAPTGTYDQPTARAVEGFQGKRGLPRTGALDTVTWQRLLAMTHEPGRRELYPRSYPATARPAAAADARCLTGRVLCIDKTSRTLRWMIDGRTVETVAVRFGTQYTPTREGVFHVYWKSRHHVSTLYHSAMPYAMFFSGGQAVHYSPDFAARGYAGGSHGCVNVRDEAAIARLFAQVRVGDKVVVSR